MLMKLGSFYGKNSLENMSKSLLTLSALAKEISRSENVSQFTMVAKMRQFLFPDAW